MFNIRRMLIYSKWLILVNVHFLLNGHFLLNVQFLLSLVLLLIIDLTYGLRLHQFLVTKSEEANKSVKTDAN